MSWGFPGSAEVKNSPAMQETSLGQKDPLEKQTATHSSILAWEILWTGEPDWLYTPRGHKESLRDKSTSIQTV